jgi:hypothetical protein
MEITAPGVYDLTSEAYHADPVPERLGFSLSVSGAKKLLPPSCPALYEWGRRNERPAKKAFDFGHAAHSLVLGVGAEIATIAAGDWRTKAAQAAKTEAYAEGKVPLLADDVEQVKAMAESIRAHPVASALLNPANGKAEQALFRQDEQGVWLRSMLDWLPNLSDGRMVIPDYKTAISASPSDFAKAVANFKYHMQAAWYMDMVTALGLAEDVAFVFIVQEKTAPYLVTVCELDAEAIRIGRELNRQAIDLYAMCQSDGVWPGYTDEVALVSLPTWATYIRSTA